jgi:hypothetical protein
LARSFGSVKACDEESFSALVAEAIDKHRAEVLGYRLQIG